MFENLSERLERSFKILKGEGKITEINVAETLKDVRRALLDADVNYKVAKTIYRHGKNQSIGARRTHRREAGTIDGEDRTRRTGDLDGWRNRRSKLVAKSVDYPHVGITGFG